MPLSRRNLFRLSIAACCAGGTPLSAQAPSIVGTWHGNSLCVDTVRHPACHDEEVIYEVTARASTRDTVDLRADKVVNGVREDMGALVFVRGGGGRWTSNMVMPRYHGLWEFTVEGDSMTGSLIDLPDRTPARRVAVRRVVP